MNSNIRWENGLQFLERLQERDNLLEIEPALFPVNEFKAGTAVEICGKSGVGKSEILLNLIAKCLLPVSYRTADNRVIALGGLHSRVVIMDNDHHFSMLRLISILRSKLIKVHERLSTTEDADDDQLRSRICDSSLKNLRVMRCTTGRQMLVALQLLDEITVHEEPFSVLVVDSVSAFYWEDRMILGSYRAVSEHHRSISDVIRHLMDTHKVTVFCTNQDLVKRNVVDHVAAADSGTGMNNATSVMGRDFQELCDWKLRLTRDPLTSADIANRILVDIGRVGRSIRRTSFDICEDGIIFS